MSASSQIKRRMGLLALAAILAVAVVAAGVVFGLRSFDSAESGITPFRLCDTVVPLQEGAKPGDPEVFGVSSHVVDAERRRDYRPNMRIIIVRESDGTGSRVVLDPRDASVVKRAVNPGDQGTLDPVLAGTRVEPLDAATAPWPYTPKGGGETFTHGPIQYRYPDAGAGLLVVVGTGSGAGTTLYTLSLANCRSQMDVTVKVSGDAPEEWETLTDRIEPEDRDAFEAFRREVMPVPRQ